MARSLARTVLQPLTAWVVSFAEVVTKKMERGKIPRSSMAHTPGHA